MTVTSKQVGSTSIIDPTANLTYTPGTVAGQPAGATRLSLDGKRTTSYGSGQDVQMKFTYRGTPIDINNLSYSIGDIDGSYPGGIGVTGAEHVYLTRGTGTISDARYVGGKGTPSNPWTRRRPSVPDVANVNTASMAGAVRISAGSGQSFALIFRVNGDGQYNIWITPTRFAVSNPHCS